MKILMAASEMAPLIRNGQLGDAMADLSRELLLLGHDVSVVIPYYRSIRENKAIKAKKSKLKFSVQVGASKMPCEIFETKTAEGVTVYLAARDEYFDRSGVYGVDGRDYQDNAARFIYFTKTVLELAGKLDPMPDILHAHSWETALLPVFSRDQRKPFRTVLTPHSLEYQGNFWSYDFGLTNLPGEYFSARGVEYFGSMNCLKAGILFADSVILPGERYVCEAQTEAYGCGLQNVLREHQHKLVGIPTPFGLEGWGNLKRAKLPEALGLDPNPKAVISAIASASGGQGLSELFASLDRLLADDIRMALLGELPPEQLFAVEVAKRKHAGRFAHQPDFDDALARSVLAASDFFLVPGPVEPDTFWLRRALAGGVVPIVAQCGGLFQTVRDWESGREVGSGFVFSGRAPDGLRDACRRALHTFESEEQKSALRQHCRQADFSSRAAARAHVAAYERLLGVTSSVQAA